MNKVEILEYLRTIFIALLVALFLAAVATGCSNIVAEHHARMLAKISNTAKDNELIGYLITVYLDEAKKNPGDYSINVRLGNLYELMFSYKQAEEQYIKAINKSPYGVYSSYLGLANLYVKQGRYSKAVNIVKRLKNTDHKPLLIAKGDFYMNLGDALWQKNKYEAAVKQYKIAFFYYKKVDSQKKDMAVSGILDCYNEIADKYYKLHRIDRVIESLETALLYKETPVLLYKLAILYKDFDPVTANKYMEKTYKMDPGLINYDLYEELLIKLIKFYYENGDDLKTELYKHKLKSIKTFQKRYVITNKDVAIDVEKLKVSSSLLKTKHKINIKFRIENNSKYDFNTLYLVVKLRYDDKSKTILEQKLFSKKHPLKSRKVSGLIDLKYSYTDKDEIYAAKDLWIDFYAGKKDNMRKIPVYSIKINQEL